MSSVYELSKLVEFSSHRILKKDILKAHGFNLALVCLDSGQVIPPHMEGYDAAFLVLDGEGVFTVGEEEIVAGKGSIVMSPKEKLRGIKSVSRLSLLGIREETQNK